MKMALASFSSGRDLQEHPAGRLHPLRAVSQTGNEDGSLAASMQPAPPLRAESRFCHAQEISHLPKGHPQAALQATLQIDAGIGRKDLFRIETMED
ncbi:hypothetical protein [Desulfatiglans anilini]|uniref:hypothetical protein n=1 Tax=Desulfatiglans anilini TaxID=90728 RepID=UPI0012946C05|nr:hypothetical protein [Desulfatiglans anilini]